jgi:hypothetical protein
LLSGGSAVNAPLPALSISGDANAAVPLTRRPGAVGDASPADNTASPADAVTVAVEVLV